MLRILLLIWIFLFACTPNSQQVSLERAQAFSVANEHIRAIANAIEHNQPEDLPDAASLQQQLLHYLEILEQVSQEHDYPLASYFEAVYFAVTHTAHALFMLDEPQKAEALLTYLDPYLSETHLYGKLKMFRAELAIKNELFEDAARDFKVAARHLEALPSYEGASTRLWLCDAWLKAGIQQYRLNRSEEAFICLQTYIERCLQYRLHVSGLGHAYGAFLGMLAGSGYEADQKLVNDTFSRIEQAVAMQRQIKQGDLPDLTEPDTPARHEFETIMGKRFQANLTRCGRFKLTERI